MYRVIDDFGFLSILDPYACVSFLDPLWEWQDLRDHFVREMEARHLIIWGTGLSGDWKVSVHHGITNVVGYREISGSIDASSSHLCLVNYWTLSGAATYDDVTLPTPDEDGLMIPVLPGLYNCRIIQMFNPETDCSAGDSHEFDFAVELQKVDEAVASWVSIPWSDD